MAESKKILIVDDDQDLVASMRIPLEAEGFTVEPAYSVEEADVALKRERPDLIILDVMLSTKTDGFQMSYKIKKDERLKDIPILMLTGIESETPFKFSPGKDGDYLPVEGYLTKPVEPETLINRAKELLKLA